jgi:hypothetical protein
MATITKYISLYNEVVGTRAASTYSWPSSTATADQAYPLVRIHKADYGPLTAAYFEAVLKTSATTRTAYCTLVNSSATSVATSVVTTTSTTAVRVRSGDISGDANFTDDQDWSIQIKRNSTTVTISVYSARLLITQTGTVTATETQITLGNQESNYADPGTSYVDFPTTGYFLYTAAKWDGTRVAYLDVTTEGGAAVVMTIALCDVADNSVIGSCAVTPDAVVRTRSANLFASLVDGHTYKIMYKNASAIGTNTCYDARLIFQQTATPTLTETYLPIRTTEHTTTATTHTDLFGYFYWDVSEIDVSSYVVLHEATIKNSDATKTTNVDVNNATDGDLDTRSTSSLTKVLSTSGSLTFTDHTENTAHLRLTATAATGTMSGSHLKIQTVIVAGGTSISPSISPSLSPSISPSVSPSVSKSQSVSPSVSPSASPSASKSISPSISPSISASASVSPSVSPSASPSASKSISPSISPSVSASQSISPSVSPSPSPSISPSISPSVSPSVSASQSVSPSISPSPSPSISPSVSPSISPSVSASQSVSPSVSPSASPSVSASQSVSPSVSPSASSSISPSTSPSISSSISPSASISPSISPSASVSPSISPSPSPSISPSASQSVSPSVSPSASVSPSISPSASVSISPSASPSISPSVSPSVSKSQSVSPSVSPSASPSASKSISPSISPSISASASVSPSISPSASPSISPSVSPSPSASPSASPSVSPSASPSPSEKHKGGPRPILKPVYAILKSFNGYQWVEARIKNKMHIYLNGWKDIKSK